MWMLIGTSDFFDELSKLAIKLNFETLLFTAKLIVIANHICRT